MDIRPIRNECDYKQALQVVSGLVDADPAPGTPDGDRLEVLATLIERYEADHYPMSTSVKALRFDDCTMWVDLSDGRTLGVPLAFLACCIRPPSNVLITVSARPGMRCTGRLSTKMSRSKGCWPDVGT